MSPRVSGLMLAGVSMLLLAEPLAAQSTGRSISSRPGALYQQGLPPATMQDLTGRSPGSLSRRATTPNAPSIILPANPDASDRHLDGRIPPPRESIED